MNITMIAGTFYLMFLFCGLGYRRTALVTILIVVLYVGLAGGGIPVQRAGYGAVLVLIAAIAGRPSSLLNSLCFAFLAILLWNPQSLWSPGFQLSFLCVLSLILILPVLARAGSWTLSLGSSLAVLVGTFPVVLYYFNIFSPVSILANIVAIPLCDAALFFSLFALLLSGTPLLGAILVKTSSWAIAGSLGWVKYLSGWRWGYFFLERPSLARIAVYYAALALVLFFYRRTFPAKRFVLTGLICVWSGIATFLLIGPADRGFEVTLLASGRNQIVRARFSNGAEWLVNAGRHFPSDQGEWLIGPYLRHEGIRKLEGILLTDLSGKHTGGLVSVLRDFPVRYLLYPAESSWVPEGFCKTLRILGRKARCFREGDEVSMGNEKMKVLARSPKGIAALIQSDPWKILFISRWDPGLFSGISRDEAFNGVHIVFLPAPGQGVPPEFDDWLERTRPLLAVLPEAEADIAMHLVSRGIPFLELKRVGALSFRRSGPHLELFSFLKKSVGFFAYS